MRISFASLLLTCLSVVCLSFTNLSQPHKAISPTEANLQLPPDDPYIALDEYAMKSPKSSEKKIANLADYLLKAGPKNDQEKTRLLFTWVATHIRYDMDSYTKGKSSDCSAEAVLARKTSVCEGYSDLFKKLGEAMGLEVVKIVGYDKGHGYKEGGALRKASHAWNAVKVDGNWELFDATWAAGSIIAGAYVFKFEPLWFNVNPKAFIFHHLPEDAQWQLLDRPLTLKQFEKLPFTHYNFFKLGFDTDSVFQACSSGTIHKLPESFYSKYPVTILEGPFNGVLKKGQSYKFVLECKGVEAIRLIDGEKFRSFTREGDRFYIEYRPVNSVLRLSYKVLEKDKDASTLLRYQVK